MKTKVFVPVPVSERLPEKDPNKMYTFVDYGCPGGFYMVVGCWYRERWEDSEATVIDPMDYTHWLEERELHVFTQEEADRLIAAVKKITFKSIDELISE